jgi:hypothetical protein
LLSGGEFYLVAGRSLGSEMTISKMAAAIRRNDLDLSG